jgi:2-(1,2-epoxy-1,2-dihydrophenyl)acetyl-CoA isomerase
MADTLLIDKHERVTTLTINRPEVRNALDDETAVALRQAVDACADDGTRCIVLTGAGGSFCSGADIKKAFELGVTPERVQHTLVECYHPALRALRAAPWPVIAAVDGSAAGIGFDFALTCDLRLVSARARFAEMFARVGLIPDGGGTYLLPRVIGLGRALELMFTGRDVLADEALHIGLANAVYPAEQFAADVAAFAARLAAQSPHALRRGKAAMLAALESTHDAALAQEAAYQREIFAQPDGLEGFAAFMQKRPPVWD